MSFFEKLEQWKEEYVVVKHIFLNLNDYSNIQINFPVGMFLILMAVAFTAAVFVINYRKNCITRCVKQLLRHNALGEANAKTLKALKLDDMRSLKRMLISNGQLSSMVSISGYVKPSYEEYIKKSKKEKSERGRLDMSAAKIHLIEEKKEYAETIAAGSTSSIVRPILVSLVFLAISALLFIFMPNILEFINSRLA